MPRKRGRGRDTAGLAVLFLAASLTLAPHTPASAADDHRSVVVANGHWRLETEDGDPLSGWHDSREVMRLGTGYRVALTSGSCSVRDDDGWYSLYVMDPADDTLSCFGFDGWLT